MLTDSTKQTVLAALNKKRKPLAESLEHFYSRLGWPGGHNMPPHEKQHCDKLRERIAAIDAAIAEVELAAQDAPAPDWTVINEKYLFWSVDARGIATVYTHEPERIGCMWDSAVGENMFVGYVDLPLGVDWRTLKARRPVGGE